MSDLFEGLPTAPAAQDPVKRSDWVDAAGQRLVVKCARWGGRGVEARRRLRTHYLITTGLDIEGVPRAVSLAAGADGLTLKFPWADGESLATLIPGWCAASSQVHLARLRSVASRLAGILSELAENGVIHGAMVAEHVIVDPSGQIALLNFGRARFMRGQGAERGDGGLSHDDDLRALGLLLIQVATGQRLALEQHADARAVAAACKPEQLAGIPSDLLDVIVGLLDAGLGGYRHAGDVAADLARGQRLADVARRPPPDFVIPMQRLGREAEIGALLGAYADVSNGASGELGQTRACPDAAGIGRSAIVLLDGLAGVGKSSVVLAACEVMARHGALIGLGKFNQFGDSRPLWAMAQALDGVLARLQSEDATMREQVIGRIQAATAGVAAALFDFLPRLAQLVGPQPEPPALSGEACQVRFELALRRLIGALGDAQHPVVLALDDIHWSDTPSLRLIEGLIGDSSVSNMLIIGAYRSEAVSVGHAILESIQRILAGKRDLRRVTVRPWKRDDMLALLRLSHVASPDGDTDLADLLMAETLGNPFRTVLALRALYGAQAFVHVPEAGVWRTDLECARTAITGVQAVTLTGRLLEALPAHTRRIVATGALLGASFDLETIARASALAPDAALRALWPALRAGLLELIGEEVAPIATLPLRLMHDIVQQAAHLSVRDAEGEARHAEIGRALLAAYRDAGTLDENLFEVVHQLNRVAPDALSDSEKRELAGLNAAGGDRARARNAGGAALEYYRKALDLIMRLPTPSEAQIFNLRRDAAEAAYLAARFDTLDNLLRDLDAMQLDVIDASRVHELRIQGLVARNRLIEALAVGETALQSLGECLVQLPPPDAWPSVPTLAEMPARCVAEARVDASLRLLVWLTPCAYITSFEMYARVILTMIHLARAHPASPLTAIAYTNYGLSLCGTGRLREGVAAGELALALAERVADEPLRCKVRTLTYGFVQHWCHPVRASLQHLRQTVDDCLRCGDQEYLGYAAFLYCDKAWNLLPVHALEQTHSPHTALVEQFGHAFSHRHCLVWLQFMRALRGDTDTPLTLRGTAFDAQAGILQLEEANNHFSLFTAHTLSAILAWHRGDVAETLRHCETGNRYAMTGGATLLAIDHRLFWCLAVLWTIDRGARPKPAQLQQLDPLIAALRQAALTTPHNVAHKLALIEAELAWAEGASQNAWQSFERAGQLVEASDFLHDRGLIAERTAAFYRHLGMERLARERLHAACEHYLAWGAKAVVANIASNMPAHAYREDVAAIELPFDLSDRMVMAFDNLQLERMAILLHDAPNLLLIERSNPSELPELRHISRDAPDSPDLPVGLLSAARERNAPCWHAKPGGEGVSYSAALPLHSSEHCIGVVYAETFGGDLLSDGGGRLALHCQALLDALRIDALTRRLEQSDQIDSQSGLPNRAAMIRAAELSIAQARAAHGQVSAAVLVKARNFDEAAVVAGSDRSPAILKEVLARLRASADACAMLARIDRLSFGFILSLRKEAEFLAFGRRLLSVLNRPYHDCVARSITFDLGLCIDDGAHEGSSLIRDAEAALNSHHGRGPGELIRFSPETHRRLSERDTLERDLRWALDHQGLRLVYQPVVDMRDNAVLGAEALVRWRHPIRGEVPVVLMIEIAEETGLIRDVGRRVMQLLVPQLKRWSVQYPERPWSVSFNASPLELRHEDYAGFLLDTLRRHALFSERITLEITESTSIHDESTTRENLRRIREAGIKLSIDDFGVGTSSLSRLHEILADRIKIDRSFIEGVDSNAGRSSTVQMIIKLTKALGLDIIAEGVSSPAEVRLLRRAGVVKAQGSLYSGPVETDAFEHMLKLGRI